MLSLVWLAVFSIAMVVAMVRYSRAVLASQEPGIWFTAYLLSWAGIIASLVFLLDDALERNLAILIAFPLGWFALHALILRFGIALRDAPPPPARPRVFEDVEDVEDVIGEPPPPPLTLTERVIAWLIVTWRKLRSVLVALVIIVIGQQLGFLHQIDRALAPYRSRLVTILALLIALGFALFMGGIIRFVLRGGQSGQTTLHAVLDSWRDGTWTSNVYFIIVAGVFLWLVSAAALGIVVLPPGLKLLVILTIAYTIFRIATAALSRT